MIPEASNKPTSSPVSKSSIEDWKINSVDSPVSSILTVKYVSLTSGQSDKSQTNVSLSSHKYGPVQEPSSSVAPGS